jgi:hypothetical protein
MTLHFGMTFRARVFYCLQTAGSPFFTISASCKSISIARIFHPPALAATQATTYNYTCFVLLQIAINIKYKALDFFPDLTAGLRV